MPKNQPTAAKKARALAAEQNLPYVEALRRTTSQAEPAAPRSTTAALRPGPRDGQHTVTIEGREHPVTGTRDLNNLVQWAGWDLAPGQDLWQLLAADSSDLHLTRNPEGILMDQAAAIWADTACDPKRPGHAETIEPYAYAVVAAIEAAGGRIADWDGQVDDDRRIYITLGQEQDDEDDTRRWILGWTDQRGWFTFLEAPHGEALGSNLTDLTCGAMALPADLAAEVAHLWGGPTLDAALPAAAGDAWQPPAGYVECPELPDDPGDIVLDLERSLATYLTHPAWIAAGRVSTEEN